MLNQGLMFKRIHRTIKFNQKAWLNSYTDKLRTEAKNDFEKQFLKLMNNSVFGKTIGDIRDYRD